VVHRSPLASSLALAFLTLALLSPRSAAAEDEPAWQSQAAQRRSGFSAGVALGLGVGSVAGYPNDVRKIGFESYYTETGLAPGGSMHLWLGGALSDWLNFGVGFAGGSLSTSDTATSGGGILFRVETFPFYAWDGRYRDLGVSIEAGTGASTTTPADDADSTLIDSGSASMLGVGAFYEGIRVWQLGMGPFASFDYVWSSTVLQPQLFLGWRTAVYSGP
jgi:hypothetical protein